MQWQVKAVLGEAQSGYQETFLCERGEHTLVQAPRRGAPCPSTLHNRLQLLSCPGEGRQWSEVGSVGPSQLEAFFFCPLELFPLEETSKIQPSS